MTCVRNNFGVHARGVDLLRYRLNEQVVHDYLALAVEPQSPTLNPTRPYSTQVSWTLPALCAHWPRPVDIPPRFQTQSQPFA